MVRCLSNKEAPGRCVMLETSQKRENVPGSPVVVCLRVRLLTRVRSLAHSAGRPWCRRPVSFARCLVCSGFVVLSPGP